MEVIMEKGFTGKKHTEETKQKCGNASRTHGMTKTTEYSSWRAMKTRCYNKNMPAYKNYGGRGISVCDKWLNSFPNFYADMGLKPEPKRNYSIERRENAGNYEPNNCYWATAKQQANNRRKYPKNRKRSNHGK